MTTTTESAPSEETYAPITSEKELRARFRSHAAGARRRGIEFLLTFEEWLKIWTDSGHLHERGAGRDKYCMARRGDVGPYAVGNVDIILNSQNVATVWRGTTIGTPPTRWRRRRMLLRRWPSS